MSAEAYLMLLVFIAAAALCLFVWPQLEQSDEERQLAKIRRAQRQYTAKREARKRTPTP